MHPFYCLLMVKAKKGSKACLNEGLRFSDSFKKGRGEMIMRSFHWLSCKRKRRWETAVSFCVSFPFSIPSQRKRHWTALHHLGSLSYVRFCSEIVGGHLDYVKYHAFFLFTAVATTYYSGKILDWC